MCFKKQQYATDLHSDYLLYIRILYCPLRFSLLLPEQCHDIVLVMNILFFLSADLSYLINQK